MLQIMRMSIMNIVPHKTPNIISQGVINYFNTRKLFFHKKIGSIPLQAYLVNQLSKQTDNSSKNV